MTSSKNEKHEFLYDYGRAAFEDELQRFKNIEDKSTKYLGLLSVGVIAYTIIIRFYSGSIYPAESLFQWLACAAVAITYIAMISSWSLLYRSLVFKPMPRLPFDEDFINEYEPKSLSTIHFALARTCVEAVKHARQCNSEKTNLLVKGYNDIALSMWALTFSVVFIFASNATVS